MKKNSLESLEQKIRQFDDGDFELDESYWLNLENKIMAEVEKTDLLPAPKWSLKNRWPIQIGWRGLGRSLGAAAIVFVGLTAMIGSFCDLKRLVDDGRIGSQVFSTPETLSASPVNYQTSDDFFMDIARQSLDDQTLNEIEKVDSRL